MKRWMAFLLAGVMMLASCMGAYAQTYTAENLIAELLQAAAEQLQHPSLGLTYSDGQTQAGLSAALDANGVPDVAVDYAADGLKMRLDADAAGVRFDDGAMKIAAAPETVLRALFTNEDGACLMPSVTQTDLDWMAQMAGEAMAAAAGTIEVERFAAEKDPAAAAEDAPAADAPASDEQTTVVIDVNGLLAALDAAVPALLTKYASQIDDFTARNSALLCELFGVTAIPKAEALSGLWPAGLLSSLLTEDLPLMVTVMAGPGEACGVAVLGGEEELLLISYGEGRLVAQLGSGEEALLLDSEDLWDVIALFMEAAAYVTPEALSWQYDEDERMTRAFFRLDPGRLAGDLMDGLAAAVQRNEQTVSALLERYMPWMEAFGAYGARTVTWEALTQVLLEEKDAIAADICSSIAYALGLGRYMTYAAPGSLPVLEAELALPKYMTYGSLGTLNVKAGDVQLYAVLSNQHLNATLQTGDRRMTRYELSGLLMEDSAKATLGRYDATGLQAELLLNVAREDSGFTAVLYDEARSELGRLVVDGDTARLTSGELTIEAVSLYPGLLVTAVEGEERLSLQIVEDDYGVTVSGYINGATARLQLYSDAQRFALSGSYSPLHSWMAYRASLSAETGSLSLQAGRYNMNALMSGVEADASLLADGLHLNVTAAGSSFQTELAYRPGLLEAEGKRTGYNWQLRMADMTGQAEETVRVRIDLNENIRQEEDWTYRERAWTVTAKTAGDGVVAFEIEGLQEQPVIVTLDIDAQAQAEDLTGYTWYNEAELAQMLRALLAPQPAPTPAAEPTTDPAAQPAAAQ